MMILSKNLFKIIISILTVVVVVFVGINLNVSVEKSFIGAEEPKVPTYEQTDKGIVEKGEIARGTEVTVHGKSVADDGTKLTEVETDRTFYVPTENIVSDADQIVKEKKIFARTPSTVYEGEDGPDIAGFAKKGTELNVEGYDRVLRSGEVNRYKVSGDCEGYVYGKYMAFSKEEAEKNYNEHGEYDKAVKAEYGTELYGGNAADLDYYPYERPEIKGNSFCRKARAVFLTAGAAVSDRYLEFVKESGANAVVINIDGGNPAYESPVVKEMCPTAYEHSYTTLEEYRDAVKAYNEAGIYTIGRIVCFSDRYFAKDHPESCIRRNGKNTDWVSAYSREAWYYKVSLAREAVKELGLNEIQFDYVRFPEQSYEMSSSGDTDFRNTYDEEKCQAVQNFCFYAADQIHDAGAYFSVDVFGECSNGYVTSYGQYWQGISNVVDAISSMPYTDHFGETDTWSNPGAVMSVWAEGAAASQKDIPTPAVARTWITGYNTPFWSPNVNYDYDKMMEQINALEKAGLDGGFIPWNSSSDLSKYYEYKDIWKEKDGNK